jgi:hypothetical protein
MQQHLLLLAARQAKDVTSAYAQVQEDVNARESMFSVFLHEMDKLSGEVLSLSSAVCVPPICTSLYICCRAFCGLQRNLSRLQVSMLLQV